MNNFLSQVSMHLNVILVSFCLICLLSYQISTVINDSACIGKEPQDIANANGCPVHAIKRSPELENDIKRSHTIKLWMKSDCGDNVTLRPFFCRNRIPKVGKKLCIHRSGPWLLILSEWLAWFHYAWRPTLFWKVVNTLVLCPGSLIFSTKLDCIYSFVAQTIAQNKDWSPKIISFYFFWKNTNIFAFSTSQVSGLHTLLLLLPADDPMTRVSIAGRSVANHMLINSNNLWSLVGTPERSISIDSHYSPNNGLLLQDSQIALDSYDHFWSH